MALDAATLALTAAELKTTLADAKIAKLFEPTRDELVITLRTRTETYSLLLSARSGIQCHLYYLVFCTSARPVQPCRSASLYYK